MKRLLLALITALALAAPARAQIFGNSTPSLLGDGSALAPSYSFASAQSTGMYKPGSGEVHMSVGGTTTMMWQGSQTTEQTGFFFIGSAQDALIKRTGTSALGVNAGGTTTTLAALGGVLFLEANNVTQSATSQNLHSYTVPANVMTVNGKTLRVTALFLSVNNANAKAIGFVICGGSLTFNATASIAGALRATAYITRTAANTWTTSVTIEEGLASGTLTQAKLSGTYNSTPACTDTATNTINAAVNTAGATDTSSGFFMVELLN